MKKIIRITTIPDSLKVLLKGQLKFMNQYYEIIGVSGDGDAMREVEKNEGIRTEIVEMTRTISPVKDLIATYKLYKLLKKEQPHIVHSHTPKAGIVGMLAAYLAGVKHRFHTVAGMPLLEATGAKRQLLNVVEKVTYRLATKVFPNSKGLYNIILDEKFAKADKLQVIGKGSSNGIDIEYFNSDLYTSEDKLQLKKRLGISDDDLVYVYVGRLVKDKGINELMEAFENFSKQYLKCKLLIVGYRENDLDPLSEITEAIMQTNKNIIEVGYQKDVRPYIAISDVFVFPTYREGFPNVILQAGAMGLPSIVTDINGCNEIIEHEVNGLIIPVKSVNAIIESMEFMHNNSTERNKMASKAREIIASHFQHTYIWSQLLITYQLTDNQNVIP